MNQNTKIDVMKHIPFIMLILLIYSLLMILHQWRAMWIIVPIIIYYVYQDYRDGKVQ